MDSPAQTPPLSHADQAYAPSSVSQSPKKSKTLPIIGVIVVIVVILITSKVLYSQHQQRAFYNTLLNRPSDISKDDFETVCKNRDACVGRFIVWDGLLDGDAFQGANSFIVKSVNGRAEVHTIDPLPMRLHDGDEIIFHGFLSEVNTLSPDVVNTGYVRKVVATSSQLAQQKAATDEAERQKRLQSEAQRESAREQCSGSIRQGAQQIATSLPEMSWAKLDVNMLMLKSAYVSQNQTEPPAFTSMAAIVDQVGEQYPDSTPGNPSPARKAAAQAELEVINLESPEQKADRAAALLKSFAETYNPIIAQISQGCSTTN